MLKTPPSGVGVVKRADQEAHGVFRQPWILFGVHWSLKRLAAAKREGL